MSGIQVGLDPISGIRRQVVYLCPNASCLMVTWGSPVPNKIRQTPVKRLLSRNFDCGGNKLKLIKPVCRLTWPYVARLYEVYVGADTIGTSMW